MLRTMLSSTAIRRLPCWLWHEVCAIALLLPVAANLKSCKWTPRVPLSTPWVCASEYASHEWCRLTEKD